MNEQGLEQPLSFNPDTQRDPAAELVKPVVQATESGLVVPAGGDYAKKLEAESSAPDQSVETPVEEVDPKDKTAEERIISVEKSIDDMAEDNPEVIAAKTEDDLKNALTKGAIESGEDPKVAEEKTTKLLKRIARLTGMTVGSIMEASEGSDSGLFIRFLFDIYSNPDGRMGTGSLNELKGNISKDDAYLVQALERADESSLKFFFSTTFDRNIDNLDNIKELMDEVNDDLDKKNWNDMKVKLNLFLLRDRPQSESYDFDEDNIKLIFKKFSEKSADQLRSMLHIETSETSNEADDGVGDQVQASNITPIPTQTLQSQAA